VNENQLCDSLGKALQKIAVPSISSVYPLSFQPVEEPARDYVVDGQVVVSQIVYTRNFQVYAFLIMEASQIFKLGQRAFPTCSRMESPKMVVSANGEVLNTVMSKLASLVGKADEGADAIAAPPIVLNCSGKDSINVHGAESIFLRFAAGELSILIIVSVQRV
jgi:hypothetical protein